MNNEKLNRLKEVLKVQSKSRQEDRMVEYLTNVLTEKGFDFYLDDLKNIYVTKGNSDYYPCFVAHTDTVHKINDNMIVKEYFDEEGKLCLTGIDSVTEKPSGIGGDDKCGIFLCLEMLDSLDNVKVAFFISEEIGCVGSSVADPSFFKNVGYVIQYDSPGGNSMSYTLMGRLLFDENSEFGQTAGKLILESGIDEWDRHPYTDVWQIGIKFNIACLNLAAGYYRYHTASEYVIVEDVQNSFELGLKLVGSLGNKFYSNGNKNMYDDMEYGKIPRLLKEYKEKTEKESFDEFFGDLDFFND